MSGIRPGTDIPVLWGMLWHIFKNGWEDKQFIEQRVYGMDDIRKEVEKYTPEEVERDHRRAGRAARARRQDVREARSRRRLIWAWARPSTRSAPPTCARSASLLLATGNVGAPGTGANIFRGHTNVQGATDLGLDIVTLPLYYGLVEGAWRHWSRVWEVDYEWFVDRFDKTTGPDGKETNTMNTPGIPSTRWFDATLYDKKDVKQKDNIKAMFVMGHGGNTVTRMPQAQKGIEALDLLVVCRSASDHLGGAGAGRARTTPICCRSRPATRPRARARRPTARSSGASRSSSRSSSPRTTTR